MYTIAYITSIVIKFYNIYIYIGASSFPRSLQLPPSRSRRGAQP